MTYCKPIAGYPTRTAACLALVQRGMTTRQIADELRLEPVLVSALIRQAIGPTCGRGFPREATLRHGRPVHVSADVLDALAPHAARRGVTLHQLVGALLAAIADDGLVDGVLDDAAELPPQPRQVPA